MSKIKLALSIVDDLRSLANSIETLAATMEGNEPETKLNTASKKSKVTKEPKAGKETAIVKEPEQKQPTLEELRAAMAEKNREGHREKVKAIIVNHGANKLTALDPACYSEVLKEVEAIK